MKLIIDIPEETYNLLKTSGVDWLGAEHILDAVSKGTPLSKGHGDLVDRNDLSLMTVHLIDGTFVCDAPTIIEADKENKQ